MEKQTAVASSCFFLLYIATFTEVLEAHHHHHRHNRHGSMKLFVFGDSYVDTGNTGKSVSASWKEPYGINFPGKPAGRFSDGFVLTDYIASFLGISSPVPYTLRKFVKKSRLESGMNFAYGGTGVFDTVFGGPNLTTQIDFFQQLLEQKLYSTKNDVVNLSIALVSVAGNDYAAYFGNHTEDFAAATKSIIKQLAVDLERIHGLGVRKIAVTAIGPLGCLPRMTSFLSYQNCSEVANLVSIFHNQILRQKVEELNKETKKSSFVILDLYNASLSAIMLPKHSQGYSTLQINPLKPCCVGVSKEYSCGSVDESGAKKYIVCDKPKLSFFWDTIHPSQNGWHEVYSAIKSSLRQLYLLYTDNDFAVKRLRLCFIIDQYYCLFSEPPKPDFVLEIQSYFPIQMPVVSRCNCDRDFPDPPLPRWFPIFFQSLGCAPHEQDVVALLLSSAK